MRIAKRPVGDMKVAARGRIRSNFSTARKVTTSAGASLGFGAESGGWDSFRPGS